MIQQYEDTHTLTAGCGYICRSMKTHILYSNMRTHTHFLQHADTYVRTHMHLQQYAEIHIQQYEDTKRIQQYEGHTYTHSSMRINKYENTHKTHSSMQIHMPKV
jgi:hypothetical protein